MKIIHLTKEKMAIVDDEDFERVNAHRWYASLDSRGTKWYAKRSRKEAEKEKWPSTKIRLHHFVLNIAPHELPEDHCVDHVNHNSLDCRKSNLEIVTQAENMRRSAGWKKKKEEPFL